MLRTTPYPRKLSDAHVLMIRDGAAVGDYLGHGSLGAMARAFGVSTAWASRIHTGTARRRLLRLERERNGPDSGAD